MRRPLFVLALVVFLALPVLVLAAAPPALPGGFVPTANLTKVQLSKGWNLVKAPSSLSAGTDSSTCLQSDLVSSFAYDPAVKNYVEVGSARFTQFLQANPDYLAHTALWMEVKRDCTVWMDIGFKSEDLNPVNAGWNFVAVSPDLVYSSFGSISGTCAIKSSYYFDAKSQKWVVLGLDEPIVSLQGMGVLFSADKACDLVGESADTKGKLAVTVTGTQGEAVTDAKVSFVTVRERPKGDRTAVVDNVYDTIIRFTNAFGRVDALFDDGRQVTFTVNKKGFKEYASPNFVAKKGVTEYANVVLVAEEPGQVFAGSPYRGSPNAPINIEVFENFVDADSRLIQGVVDELEAYYGSFVKIVHKDFPLEKKDIPNENFDLSGLNPLAYKAALAARCANEQGKFWEYAKLLYRKQRVTTPYTQFVQYNPNSGAQVGLVEEQNTYTDPANLSSYASELGLDATQFKACMATERYKDAIMADVKEGYKGLTYSVASDIDAVPTIRINGTKFTGLNYFYVYKLFIDGLLMENLYDGAPLTGAPFYKDPTQRESHPDYPLRTQPVVTIVEFCDFESKECKTLNFLLQRLMADYQKDCTGADIKNLGVYGARCSKVMRRLHKDYPLPIHLRAMMAAEAARCSAAVTDYWKFHDELYQYQPDFSPSNFEAIFRSIEGPDYSVTYQNTINRCIEQDRYKPDIERDMALAKVLGVKTIPTIFVNGTMVEGLPSYETLKALVDQKFAVKLSQPVAATGDALVKYCQAYPLFDMCRRGSEADVLGTKTYQ